MVVVLKQLAERQEVEGQGVARPIVALEVAVAVLVAAPIHDRTVDRAHQEVRRQQHEVDRAGRECDVEQRIRDAETDADHPAVSQAGRATATADSRHRSAARVRLCGRRNPSSGFLVFSIMVITFEKK